jgi:hypothetical protein
VHAPAVLDLPVSWAGQTCPDPTQLGQPASVLLLLTSGQRVYPVAVPFDRSTSFAPGTGCAAHVERVVAG